MIDQKNFYLVEICIITVNTTVCLCHFFVADLWEEVHTDEDGYTLAGSEGFSSDCHPLEKLSQVIYESFMRILPTLFCFVHESLILFRRESPRFKTHIWLSVVRLMGLSLVWFCSHSGLDSCILNVFMLESKCVLFAF